MRDAAHTKTEKVAIELNVPKRKNMFSVPFCGVIW